MPSVRAARIPAPQRDVTKTDPAAVTSATSAWAGAFHGTVDIVPSFGFDAGKMVQLCLWLVLAERTQAMKWNPCSSSRVYSQSLLQINFQVGIPPEIAVRADELWNIHLPLPFAERPLSPLVPLKTNELWHDACFFWFKSCGKWLIKLSHGSFQLIQPIHVFIHQNIAPMRTVFVSTWGLHPTHVNWKSVAFPSCVASRCHIKKRCCLSCAHHHTELHSCRG